LPMPPDSRAPVSPAHNVGRPGERPSVCWYFYGGIVTGAKDFNYSVPCIVRPIAALRPGDIL
jgi:hypothetical protein